MSEPLDVAKMVRVYQKIRSKRSELSANFKEEDKALSEKLDAVKAALLKYCDEQGVESVRTAEGLFYRSTKTRYWTSDWESMHKFILEEGVRQYLEENPDAVPMGLNVDSEYTLSVRKK
jgi:hypothetical protein